MSLAEIFDKKQYTAHRVSIKPLSVIAWYLREQGYKCFYCGWAINAMTATRDHVVPKYDGFSEIEGNCVLACQRCNSAKDNLEFELFMDLIDAEDQPPILPKRRNRGGRQNCITAIWLHRRQARADGSMRAMPSARELNDRRRAYLDTIHGIRQERKMMAEIFQSAFFEAAE